MLKEDIQKQMKLITRVEQEKERESYHAKIVFFTNIAHVFKYYFDHD
jgi:hypothetical protein